jgi:molybdopterin-containing oxidoreductase family iron-sulfur binding subunit
VWDGRFANNPWLQELPAPFTKLTWGNAALLGPRTAQQVGVSDGDVVRLTSDGRSIDAPAMILPGVPDGVVNLHLGYGRSRAGSVGTDQPGHEWCDRGFNAYRIRTAAAPWSLAGVSVAKTGTQQTLVTTRNHHAMSNLRGLHALPHNDTLNPSAVATNDVPDKEREISNRLLVRVGTLEEFRKNEQFVEDIGGKKEKRPLLSLYRDPKDGGWDYSTGYQWGMSIDMTACIGCNACVVACQAENNIPVVGKKEVHRQREMHWIRIDDYFAGDLDAPQVHHQPVPCMHCENAPCEYVCPVGATTHSAEGLNEMTYNRCVGTRYCSNNCPYKVRRFNFLAYADEETKADPGRVPQRNPEVTVRARGVMEKCSYCVQRLVRTRIEAERMLTDAREHAAQLPEGPQRDAALQEAAKREHEILERLETACQQSCPTEAIVFGSINPVGGQSTKVAALKQQPLDYSLLRDLTTKPRTTYLARVRNPNPALESGGGAA